MSVQHRRFDHAGRTEPSPERARTGLLWNDAPAVSEGGRHMPSVVLLGTLDTKGTEYAFLGDRVRQAGCDVILVDAGVLSERSPADISADEVAAAAGEDRAALAAAGDRGPAVLAMTRGATVVVRRLFDEGRLDGILGLGGSGGSSIIATAMQALPVGVPKLLVSTMGSGDTRPYVGTSDIAMMYSVVDIAGINGLSEKILSNAAAAMAGMARASATFVSQIPPKPLIGATMFGVTTPCVTRAREILEAQGLRGPRLPRDRRRRTLDGSPDEGRLHHRRRSTSPRPSSWTSWSAASCRPGPDRLEMAGSLGIPQVVSLGRPRHVQLRAAGHRPRSASGTATSMSTTRWSR